MSKPKLSLIIAVYNIRKYVAECIDSCINQLNVSTDDYEIIIVNDGSTDDSADIAGSRIVGVPNARLLTKINGGLSDARNFGLKNAKGEYVWFIDGDDMIAPNAVKSVIDAIPLQAQVYMIDYFEIENGKDIITRSFSEKRLPGKMFNGCQMIEREDIPFPPMMAWLQIQNREFILNNGLEFLFGAKSEDLEYTAKLFAVATQVYHIKHSLYYYRLNRNDSITNSLRNNQAWIMNLLRIYQSVDRFISSIDTSEKYRNHILFIISQIIIYNHYSQKMSEFQKSKLIIESSGIDIYSALLRQRTLKGVALYIICKYMPDLISRKILGRFKNRI